MAVKQADYIQYAREFNLFCPFQAVYVVNQAVRFILCNIHYERAICVLNAEHF